MTIPKPQAPKKQPAQGKDEKKPYVLNPHLHQKPFRDHEGLNALKAKLVQSNHPAGTRRKKESK